jgi:subtilase family serine protease
MTVEDQIFQRMATQGQSMYAAAGDNGSNDDPNNSGLVQVDDPAEQPFVTGVGGTTLSGTVGAPVETTWNSAAGATGGGVSTIFTTPSYQQGVAGTASQIHRNVPDVALNADPDNSPYSIFVGGGPNLVGGTSAAAPLWAAMTALLNQQSIAEGKSSLGFANATLYTMGTSTSSAVLFTDITAGNNGAYSAGPGYDNTTGFGSFKGSAFINAATGGLPKITVTSLINVNAFPNPFDVRKPHPSVIKIWEGPSQTNTLPDGAIVKIFTLSGFWVKTLAPAANGQAVWDLTNDSGQQVASGLYFYLVKTSTDKFRGTIAIIK